MYLPTIKKSLVIGATVFFLVNVVCLLAYYARSQQVAFPISIPGGERISPDRHTFESQYTNFSSFPSPKDIFPLKDESDFHFSQRMWRECKNDEYSSSGVPSDLISQQALFQCGFEEAEKTPFMWQYKYHLNPRQPCKTAPRLTRTRNKKFQDRLFHPITEHNSAIIIALGGHAQFLEGQKGKDFIFHGISSLRLLSGWKGTIIVVSNFAGHMQSFVERNADRMMCSDAYDKNNVINSPCGVSFHSRPLAPGQATQYKFVKTQLVGVLEDENLKRKESNLAPLDYGVYHDADVLHHAPVQPFIDFLNAFYTGQDIMIFPQPAWLPEHILHGGFFVFHREFSVDFLNEWANFLSVRTLYDTHLDQYGLADILRMHQWSGPDTSETLDVLLLPFGYLYPLEFSNIKEDQWKQGVFLHLNGIIHSGYDEERRVRDRVKNILREKYGVQSIDNLSNPGSDSIDSIPSWVEDSMFQWKKDLVIPIINDVDDEHVAQTVQSHTVVYRPRSTYLIVDNIEKCIWVMKLALRTVCVPIDLIITSAVDKRDFEHALVQTAFWSQISSDYVISSPRQVPEMDEIFGHKLPPGAFEVNVHEVREALWKEKECSPARRCEASELDVKSEEVTKLFQFGGVL